MPSTFDPTRNPEEHPERRRNKVYGRRIGRPLRGDRQSALENKLPRYAITPEDITNIDPSKPYWVEIGFGNGEHLVWQAKHNPDVTIIGCEPFLNGVSYCARDLADNNLDNALLWADDARMVVENLPDASIERLFVLHPDPWPKKRHNKRRIIQKETLDQFARILKKGALFRMASDHVDMAEWMLEKTFAHPDFKWLAESAEDWRTAKADWPQTRYEAKGIKAGRKPYYLEFERK